MLMDSKEHILYFLLNGKINLSQFDQKFFSNLQMLIIKNNRITTNQAALFDKLVDKYARQLNKHSIHKETISNLEWKTNIIASTPEYTNAKVSVVDDNLTIRLPFNKNFISAFKNVDDNPFEWNKTDKMYVAKFGTYALKIATTLLPEFFEVDYSSEIQNILNELNQYDSVKYWKPTLRMVNNNLMIVAINDILYESIKDIELKLDIPTLYKLSHYGISIDEELIKDRPDLQFAGSYIAVIDLDDLTTVANWLAEINPKVLIPNNVSYSHEMIDIFAQVNILVESKKKFYVMAFENPVVLIQSYTNKLPSDYLNANKAGKIIMIKNSRPIVIK
jgi:hypothetical protein